MKTRRLFAFLILVVLVAITSTVAAQEPTQVPVSATTLWDQISAPPAPQDLLGHHDLPALIQYSSPEVGCSGASIQVSCTDPNGIVSSVAELGPFQRLVITGDEISVNYGGSALFPEPEQTELERVVRAIFGIPKHSVAQAVVVLVNIDQAPVQISVTAPHGSFRGWFISRNEPALIEKLYLNAVERFSQPVQTEARFGGDAGAPTPVPNCSDPNGCSVFNVKLGVYYQGAWYFRTGLYDEGFLGLHSWNQLVNTMPNLDAALVATVATATPTPSA